MKSAPHSLTAPRHRSVPPGSARHLPRPLTKRRLHFVRTALTVWRRARFGSRSTPRPLVVLGVAVAAHELARWWLAQRDFLAQLFAPGPHLPWLELVVAGLFLALRIGVFLLAPALLIGGGAQLLLGAWRSRPGTQKPSDADPSPTRLEAGAARGESPT